MSESNETLLSDAILRFIHQVESSRSRNTAKTYQNGMNAFLEMLTENSTVPAKQTRKSSDCETKRDNDEKKESSEQLQDDTELTNRTRVSELDEDCVRDFSEYLKVYSPTTETLYINVLKSFLEYLAAENILNLNLNRVKMLIKRRTRKPGVRLPQFPEEDIRKVLDFAETLPTKAVENESDRLINLRDSAFLITLADTGLRIHEICGLRLGDINWRTRKAIIIGKGNKEAIIRFSERSINSMRSYLSYRAEVGEKFAASRTALPVFSRHDKGAGEKVLPITTKTGRLIVSERVEECLGADAVGTITPHSFRHYFVTTVLQATGNLKVAQEFARHTNIAVTQRYSHLANEELDDTFSSIFNDPTHG